MAYTKTPWVDDSAPYIDSTNLNKIEDGIETAQNGVDALEAAANNIDILATKYISRGHMYDEGFEIELGGEVDHALVEYWTLSDGGSDLNYDYQYLIEKPNLRYSPDISFYTGESLNVQFEPQYIPGTSYSSGRFFSATALPSSGDWKDHIESGSVLGFTNGGSAQIDGDSGFLDNTSSVNLLGNLGEWGKADGRFPVADFHRDDDNTIINNYRSGVAGYLEYNNNNVLSTLSADDVVFCLSNNASGNEFLKLDHFQVGSIDLTNNRIMMREGAGHRPSNHFIGHFLLNKGFKKNSINDLAGATIYKSALTSNSWKLNGEDSTTLWPDEYVGSVIILDDGTGKKKYLSLANNSGSLTFTLGDIDQGFIDQTAYTEFDVWFWYNTDVGSSTDNIPYTPGVGVSQWGLSKYDSRILGTRYNTLINDVPWDGTNELVDEGYYRRSYTFTNNLGLFPLLTDVQLGITGDFTFIDYTVAKTRQGKPIQIGGYGSVYSINTVDAYTFDGITWYHSILSAEVGSRFSSYKPNQMKPAMKLEGGVWYYNDSTSAMFEYDPNGTLSDRINFDNACLDVNWVVGVKAAGKSMISDVAFAWEDYNSHIQSIGSYISDSAPLVSNRNIKTRSVYNDSTTTENLMYTFTNLRIVDPPENNFTGFRGGWSRLGPRYELGTFSGTKYIMAQSNDIMGPMKIIIYGKLK